MRAHRTTHPILGVATWHEMQVEAARVRRETGKRVCTWCHCEVAAGRRTRCGSSECDERIWQAYSWMRCQQVTLRENRICQCGKHATEVDHIIPVSLGGTGDPVNLRALCHDCHREETNRLRKERHNFVATIIEAFK